ncbi:hypothetical protein DFS33DRAFT_1253537, partial [Desarmillaria ectypa]
PVSGYVVSHVEDASEMLSGGILPSIPHRWYRPPPGVQSNMDRWSITSFAPCLLSTLKKKAEITEPNLVCYLTSLFKTMISNVGPS